MSPSQREVLDMGPNPGGREHALWQGMVWRNERRQTAGPSVLESVNPVSRMVETISPRACAEKEVLQARLRARADRMAENSPGSVLDRQLGVARRPASPVDRPIEGAHEDDSPAGTARSLGGGHGAGECLVHLAAGYIREAGSPAHIRSSCPEVRGRGVRASLELLPAVRVVDMPAGLPGCGPVAVHQEAGRAPADVVVALGHGVHDVDAQRIDPPVQD